MSSLGETPYSTRRLRAIAIASVFLVNFCASNSFKRRSATIATAANSATTDWHDVAGDPAMLAKFCMYNWSRRNYAALTGATMN